MSKTVVIDCFPESARHYREAYAIVAIDVIRATTTAISAVDIGRRCFPVPTLEAAVPLAARLDNPLLIGELGGNMPYGFHMTNSPAQIVARDYDLTRPMILLTSSGTELIHNAREAPACYLACLRNHGALVQHLAERHRRVAVLGAGTRGEFREEDQLCCAWIAEGLIKRGYRPEDRQTEELVGRWSGASVTECSKGNSAAYLKASNQLEDLDFILNHVDDVRAAFMLKHGEVVKIPV